MNRVTKVINVISQDKTIIETTIIIKIIMVKLYVIDANRKVTKLTIVIKK